MIWLTSPDETAAALPAAWLIATGARPADLGERSRLRRKTAHDVLARQFGLARDAVEIAHDEKGRPVLAHPLGTGLHLSLATRCGLVAIGLAHAPVGVDVERIDPLSATPMQALHPDERDALSALPEAARPLAFAQIWAAKEAYVKALGTGFLRPPESFAVSLTTRDRFTVADPDRAAPASGAMLIIGNGGQVSLAATMLVLPR